MAAAAPRPALRCLLLPLCLLCLVDVLHARRGGSNTSQAEARQHLGFLGLLNATREATEAAEGHRGLPTLQAEARQHLGFLGFLNTTREAVEAVEGPLLTRLHAQREYEFSFSQAQGADMPTVNKVVLLLISWFLGICGCDRCFVGSYITGTLKFFMLGGLGVWQLIDYIFIIGNCITKDKSFNSIGMHAKFSESSVEPAFYAAIICLIINFAGMFKGGGSAERRSKSVATIPVAVTKKLRAGGLLSARPGVPELQALFKRLDADGNGRLSRTELKEGLASLGCPDTEIDAIFKSADADGDGQVSLVEFIATVARDGNDPAAKAP